MPKQNTPLLAFNRGRISPLALARTDLEVARLSAETQTNYIPRSLGSMMHRPGFGFITPIIPKFTKTTLTVNVGGAKTLASSTGLINGATVYTATLTYLDFFTVDISVTGSAAQTYATLLDAIYDDILAESIGDDLTVSLVGGNIVFEDQFHASGSSIALVDSGANSLFASLSGFVAIGSEVIGVDDIDSNSKLIEFIYAKDDTASIALVENQMRVIVDDDYINPPSFSANPVNGHFLYTLDNWTDNDDAGATSTFAAGSDNQGYMSLVGTIFNYARRNQQVTVAGGDVNKRFQCRIVIARGIVDVKIGTSAGDGSYFSATFGKGTHWCSFTPAGNFYIEFSSATKYASLVDSLWFTSFGLLIDTDYTESDFPLLRHVQSGDVVYLACEGIRPQKIERRTTYSWSLADYLPEDGPFRPYNATGITMTPSALSGDITLTASRAFFQSGHAGALFLVDSVGQKVTSSLTGENQFSNEIRVTGTTRSFFLTISSIGTNTVTLQRSVGASGSWVDAATYTTDQTNTVFDDELENQIIYYRIGIEAGNYVGGTTVVTLEYSQGSIAGICQLVSITSATVAVAIVLREFGGTAATIDWREGAWSDYRGWPSAVALYESRLWWAGKQKIDGSATDEYESFDPDLEGDSRPISRTIGFGVSDNINWMVGSQRLLLGTDARVLAAQSSSQNEPLTQDNFGLKTCTTQGSSRISPIEIDDDVAYVHASKMRLIQLVYDESKKAGYRHEDLTALCPEICSPSITHIAAQRQPDTRIHCIRSDGTVGLMAYDPLEEIWAPLDIESTGASGEIEDCVVLPGDEEDKVYYIVKREIPDAPTATDAGVVRLIEKWALESECVGGTLNKQLDAFTTYSGVSTTVLNSSNVSDLLYLEDQEVYVWGNGTVKVQGPFTVTSAAITLTYAVTEAVIGLRYTAQYKSSKLAYAAGLGTALTQRKQVAQLGLIMRNVHASGIQFGPDFDHLDSIPHDDLPRVSEVINTDAVMETYDKDMMPMNSNWNTDSRLCLQTLAPYPCTLLAAIVAVQTNDKG